MERVLLVGVGGLGCPALLALAEAGVRQVTIVDPDRVELSNLHRQILFRERDLGRPKVEVAKEALAAGPLSVRAIRGVFERALLEGHDAVLDGTDQFETKLAISDACVDARVPYVFAGVLGTDAQVLGVLPGQSACLRCLFDEAPPPGSAPSCAELGILGPIAGIAASRQVRVLSSLGSSAPLVDRLWVYDGLRDREREIPLGRAEDCRGCGARRGERGRLAAGAFDASGAGELDLSGLVCPATYVEARKALERLPGGAMLWVRLTSDEAVRSVPASLSAGGHRLLSVEPDGEGRRLLFSRAHDDEAGS